MTANPPLHGIRVIDFSTVIAGPMATALLADQGAEVIKIEEAGMGDRGRYVGSSKGGITGFFHMANRGKKSIALNLKDAADAQICRRLIATADIVLHNSRPGVMERLGLGYDDVKAIKDDIIYVAISGFGTEGPMAKQGAYDQVLQCFAGVASLQAYRSDKPALVRNVMVDKVCALYASQAVSTALFARERGQGGQKVELSMLNAAASFLWVDAATSELMLDEDVDLKPTAAQRCTLYQFADGWGTVAPAGDKSYVDMMKAFGVSLADEPGLQTYMSRLQNPDLNRRAMAEWAEQAAKLPTREAIARLEAVDVPCAPVHSLEEFATHPQVQAIGAFVETRHPQAGRLREPVPAAKFSKTPARVGAPSPTLDQHRDEILGSF